MYEYFITWRMYLDVRAYVNRQFNENSFDLLSVKSLEHRLRHSIRYNVNNMRLHTVADLYINVIGTIVLMPSV